MTRALTGPELLTVWESSRVLHLVDRVLLILRMACPHLSDETLASLPVGQRDKHLFAVRAATLGERLDGSTACPHCAVPLEFSINGADLLQVDASNTRAAATFVDGDLQVTLRPPDSRDLAAISTAASVEEARSQLLRRCVVVSRSGAGEADMAVLAPAVLDRIPAMLADSDPQTDVTLEMHCDACGHAWPLQFDIAAFFWAEIEALAHRLLAEVDALARAYGWREADILAMSSIRRSAYLGMVT